MLAKCVYSRWLAAALITLVTLPASLAEAQFAPGPDPITATVNTAQTLASGTGNVSATGDLSVNGGVVAVTVTGSSTIANLGTIQETGTGAGNTARAIRLNTDSVTLTLNNGSNSNSTALIESAGDDAFQVNKANDSATLNNYGTINSNGGQAIDWRAVVTGATTITNFSSGKLTATGSDAVRPGVNGMVNNSGVIRATPVQVGGSADGNDGVDTGANSGVQVTNTGTGTIEGRTGVTGGVVTGGPAYTISVTNQSGGIISGVNGSGVNIDGVNPDLVATIVNESGATMKGTWDGVSANGDGDGIDVDGVVNLTNNGFIRGLGANGVGSDTKANGPDGVAAGGGTIVNETGAEITAAVTTGGATGSFGILIDDSSKGNTLVAATNLTNRGLIRSDNGPAVVFFSAFANSITNDTGGTISGNGLAAVGAAIQTGDGNDTIINRGTITAVSNDLAIDMQGGNNSLTIEGGVAAITGRISGGVGGTNSLTVSPGAGKTFSYAGKLSNFNSVQINAGTTTLSGDNSYTGTTTVSGGILVAKNSGGSATGTGLVIIQSGGTLAGSGIVDDVSVQSGGSITPRTGATTATLRTRAVTFAGGGNFNVRLNGTTPGTQYDRISATGNVNLGNATLNVSLGFSPAVGASFTIVQSTGTLNGTFQGLAEGAHLTIGATVFVVHYSATAVTLTRTAAPTPTATATATATATPKGIPGATPTATAAATATASPKPTATATPTATPGLVGNVSTRLFVGAGDDALIEGFIVQGPPGSVKKVIVRAIGPALLPFGVADALTNPTLEIYDSNNTSIARNDDWKTTQIGGAITSDQAPEINNSGLAPTNDLESTIIANLAPGSYTAVVRGANASTGTGVVDAYDLSAASPASLANIATRGLVQPGDKLMIAGLIIQNGSVRAVVLAIGPSLKAFGITNALSDTTLQLRDENGAIVRENDDWKTDQQLELESTDLQPSDDLEAALVSTLPPGQYTAQVRGKPEATGIGVVQVYFIH